MDNELTSAEGKYFLYIIESLSSLEEQIDKTFKDRDFKIKLILYNEYSDFRENLNKDILNVKSMINNLDLKNLNVRQLESIASELNDVINKFQRKIEVKNVDNICG